MVSFGGSLGLISFFFFCYGAFGQPDIEGFTCTVNRTTANSCHTYVVYRATSPNYLDLASIGDLFSVSRRMIANPSNITNATTPLLPDELLFVPITCSCNQINSTYAISYAGLNYTIFPDDTYWIVSTEDFQNLTTYQSVEIVNPSFDPNNLQIGDVIVFPIFCRCPSSTQSSNSINYLITYVLQTDDTFSSVASRFGVTESSLMEVNGDGVEPLDTIFIPVSRLPNMTRTQVPVPPPTSTPPSLRTERRGVIVGLGVALGICGFLLLLVCGIWCFRESKMKKKLAAHDADYMKIPDGSGNKALPTTKTEEMNVMADVSGCLDKYKLFSIDVLRAATNAFDDKSVIQGSVYKGFVDGECYAIKKMKWNAYDELKILQKVNHGNLVRLEGFCIDSEEANCYLVYEYVENGSLYSWLHEKKASNFSWNTRLRIAIDVANGLQYIHEHTRPKVVHKDIKSSNILLDSSMRAKIANFGLAKSGCNAITMHIVGTQGYIAPEYLADGIVSTKMDVFSFGVVLLELITGREAIDHEGNALWVSAIRIMEGNEEDMKLKNVMEWMDVRLLKETCPIESVMNVMGVAVACLEKDPSKRPSMIEIVYALSKNDDMFFDVSQNGLSPKGITAR